MFIQKGTRAGVISVAIWLLVNSDPSGLQLTLGMAFMHASSGPYFIFL